MKKNQQNTAPNKARKNKIQNLIKMQIKNYSLDISSEKRLPHGMLKVVCKYPISALIKEGQNSIVARRQ